MATLVAEERRPCLVFLETGTAGHRFSVSRAPVGYTRKYVISSGEPTVATTASRDGDQPGPHHRWCRRVIGVARPDPAAVHDDAAVRGVGIEHLQPPISDGLDVTPTTTLPCPSTRRDQRPRVGPLSMPKAAAGGRTKG